MKILPDECLPRKLKRELAGHVVFTVPEMGWAGIKNGKLLQLMESGFEAFITVDSNMQYQQNLKSLQMRFLVIKAHENTLDALLPLVPEILLALDTIKPGQVISIS